MDHRAAVVEEILKGAHAGVPQAVRRTDIKGDPSPHAEDGDEFSTGGHRLLASVPGAADTGK